MNRKARALTEEEFVLIIQTIRQGFIHNNIQYRPNSRIAAALTLQGNMGMRIGDIVALKLSNIIRDGNRYRLDIVEEKTYKKREFSVLVEIQSFLQGYAIENGLKTSQRLFAITTRQVNKHLKAVIEYLKLDGNISSHSFRNFMQRASTRTIIIISFS